MDKIWTEVQSLVRRDALHVRRNVRLSELSIVDIADSVRVESSELLRACNVLKLSGSRTEVSEVLEEVVSEIGDVLGALSHLMQRLGVSIEDVENAASEKFKQRFA